MRLYLLKDAKQDLLVDTPLSLPQHQLDGIRFLYKQFKKKNPGVVMNDPHGYGNRMQVVLFMKGIKVLLQKPILVFCPEESVYKWKQHLQEWADYSENDISIESSNAFAKHLVFINTIEDVSAFCRRHWSIVIFENNNFHKDTANVTKKVLHFCLNSEFKIWVTSVDIKAHLDLFPSMYHWLNPGDKTNIQELTQKGNGLKDEIKKSIILEAFLEDIVIRRNNFSTPFKLETEETRDEVDLEETRKRSRKCKDITGKKVKRSKKRVIEDNGDKLLSVNAQNNSTVNLSEVTVSTDDHSNEYFNFINDKNTDVVENTEMDVETFIRDQEPIKSSQSNNSITNTNDFINAVNEIVSIENENKVLRYDSPSLCEIVEDEMDKTEVTYASGIISGNSKTPAYNDVDSLSINEEDALNRQKDILNKICKKEKVKEEISEVTQVNNVKTSDNIDNKFIVATHGDENLKETETKPTVKKDITEQILDLEKEALKRFKGSILDNLFKF